MSPVPSLATGSPAAPERLNRYLARRGVASRRGADALIAAGRVRVNGRPGLLGASVAGRDRVTVDGRPVPAATGAQTFLLNKPAGCVTTRSDPQGRPTVMRLVPAAPGLVPVGRLDADTRGLLLLSNDGELVHRLSHPRFGVPRRYRARFDAPVAAEALARLRAGLLLGDGPARPLAVRRGRSPGELEIVMAEGRNREVRRLCQAAGLHLVDLQRSRFGPLSLGRLAEGRARQLGEAEVLALRRLVGLDP